MGLPLVISEYRQKKILKRYQVTPASPALLLAVQTAVYTVYSLASLVLVYAAAVLFFGGAFSGLGSSVPGCIPVCDAGHIQHRHDDRRHCPGCRTAGDVGQHTVFSHAGSFFSGATLPYETMPSGLQRIADMMPLTQGIKLLKAVSLGLPAEGIWKSCLYMAVCFFWSAAGCAALFFRWE